ncbi:hypothetical protein [Raoultibacter phocaeensis]|uniref:hypothetical protein n=1 Tax=Raoultibacter phocaeensis TaxID=2479841 RepID=UPI001119137C|nr:hypothetical protein [Raoultibacter phocaeensis]
MADIPRTTSTGLVLFALAALFTFGFITLLQFAPMPWFFGALIAMHAGIALFIVSKRLFKSCSYIVARYYRLEYVLLVPYLLIMAYAFASKAGVVPLFETQKSIVTLAYTAFCFGMTLWNFARMRKDVRNQQIEVIATREALGAI